MKLSTTLFAFFVCLSFLFSLKTNAQSPTIDIAKRLYFTQSVAPGDVHMDGILDEAAWQKVDWGKDFLENQPNSGTAPYLNSQFRILYDDKYLYVGYRAFDSAPDSIVARMSRRDEFPGDWMEINIDSYHDLRTAFSFTFSVSGVRGDEFVSNNGNNWDTNWNPIWDGKSHIDSLGWTAEIKIPFSQLRYSNLENQVWGFQVQRRIFRQEERSMYQFIPQNSGGWVSYFAELHGLKNLPNNKGVELAPYVLAKTERFEKVDGNPFADGSKNQITAGVDGKLSVTRDLILDFTINPDFGQVEADPGAVRLDGFQNFFSERRPFFQESRNLFDYQITGSEAGGDYDSDLLFYSRRIGGSPHGYPDLKDGEFSDVPNATSILGAAKFSGKTKKGWSIGVLESVTQRENAKIDLNGTRRKELVEPLTNYFVGRLIKDFDEGNTIFGAVLTGVNREKGLNWLHRNAYSGGLDFQHFWNHRWWYVKANAIFSRVEGSEEAILGTQTSFGHYFQRSNADYLHVDDLRTSLTGSGGTFKIGKIGGKANKIGGIVKFETGITFRSPELELNDLGFMQTADEINHFAWAGYQINKPFSVFRQARINYNHWTRWDFGGQFLYSAFNTNLHGTFKNQWSVGTGSTINPNEISNTALRGGSSLRRPPGMGWWFYVESDGRKRVSFNVNPFFAWGFGNTVRIENYDVSVSFQPLDALKISFNPGLARSWRKQDQFVDQAYFGTNQRTIVSEVEQRTFYLTGRLNYNITPDLTIQYYGQPFISRGLYKNYGYVSDPLNHEYDARFHQFSEQEITPKTEKFSVDENLDGTEDYSFKKPDFNYIQFRSNLVARWEYIPGSEIYLVWSQGAVPNADSQLNTPLVRCLFDNAFDEKAQNIFLVKMTYRFLR